MQNTSVRNSVLIAYLILLSIIVAPFTFNIVGSAPGFFGLSLLLLALSIPVYSKNLHVGALLNLASIVVPLYFYGAHFTLDIQLALLQFTLRAFFPKRNDFQLFGVALLVLSLFNFPRIQ